MKEKNNKKIFLYGTTEILPGNEDKIIICFPVVKTSINDFFITQESNWSIHPQKGAMYYGKNTKSMSEGLEELKDNCYKPCSKQEILIKPSQMLGIMGPIYVKRLSEFYERKEKEFTGKTYPFERNFSFFFTNPDSYKDICLKISGDTIESFDNELSQSKGGFISNKAKNALELMTFTYTTLDQELYLRTLASYKINGKNKKYREELILASFDLGISKEEIKSLAEDYISKASK